MVSVKGEESLSGLGPFQLTSTTSFTLRRPDEGSAHVKNGKAKKRKKEREKGSSFRGWKGTLMTRIMALISAEGTSPRGVGE